MKKMNVDRCVCGALYTSEREYEWGFTYQCEKKHTLHYRRVVQPRTFAAERVRVGDTGETVRTGSQDGKLLPHLFPMSLGLRIRLWLWRTRKRFADAIVAVGRMTSKDIEQGGP